MPESQISKLRRRVEQLSGGFSPNQSLANQPTLGVRQQLVMSEREVFGKLSNSETSKPLTGAKKENIMATIFPIRQTSAFAPSQYTNF